MTPSDPARLAPDQEPGAAPMAVAPLSSLRARLSFLILLAFIPAIFFLIFETIAVRQRVRSEAQAEMLSLTQVVADSYGKQVEEAERLLAAITLFPEIQTGDAAACSARLAQVMALYQPQYRGFGVSNLDGEMFCTSAPVTTTIRIDDRLWFRDSVRTGQFAIGEYAASRPSGLPTLGLGYPVLDEDGNATRVVSHGLLLSALQAEANELPLPDDAVLTIADRNGAILVRSPDGEPWIGQRLPQTTTQQLKQPGEGVVTATGEDGVTRVYAVAPVVGPSGAQVWLAIGRTPEIMYAAEDQAILRDLISVGGLLLLALMALWVGSNRLLLGRIDQLVAASARLAAGDWQARAPVRAGGDKRDELDELALTFNEMAEARRLASVELEERVRARTAELERSNRELNQFAYIASHDLKAPLRAIDNLANWIAEDAAHLLPPRSAEHLAKLRGRVKRMEKLLDDLLAYSRAGRTRPPAESVDLNLLVQDIVGILAPPPGFTVTVEQPAPSLYTPRVSLELVLRNLIGNAIKHHDQGGGQVHVRAVERGDWVEFTVSDDGPGIDAEYHQRIFEMYQTLKPRDQTEGSGMGLSIVKKLVESYGGAITVESMPGQGATFCFSWPRTPTAE